MGRTLNERGSRLALILGPLIMVAATAAAGYMADVWTMSESVSFFGIGLLLTGAYAAFISLTEKE